MRKAAPKPKSPRPKKVGGDLPPQSLGEGERDADFARGALTVRMYRDILGDCFLLRFPAGEGWFHVLVDCGILQGMPSAKERARRIMANIASVTSRIDVLVVTHEHVDHLSGFSQARDIFDGIEVDELWLAWTEDPRDEQAERLRAGRTQAMALIERSYSALSALMVSDEQASEELDDEATSGGGPSALEGLRGIMAFAGRDPAQPMPPGNSTAEILTYLRTKARRVRYFSPGGEALKVGAVPDLSIHVLGPPRVESLLRRSNPRKNAPEVYELDSDTIRDDLFLVAALSAAGDGPEPSPDDVARLKLSLPFGFKNLVATETRSRAFGAKDDGAAEAAFAAAYDRPGEEWRKVDTDWLGAAEQLALKLDSDTNNTSLVLAFRLGTGSDARVLLFPGDAQVGNWLSWDSYVWPPSAKKGDVGSITVENLLAETVLYKVGHHASHNATLRDKGLELMTSRDLVAMIPVDQTFANETKHWNMPFPSLLDRLAEKTGGRVLRADRSRSDLVTLAAERAGKAGELTPAEWERFLSRVREISDPEGAIALEYKMPFSIVAAIEKPE